MLDTTWNLLQNYVCPLPSLVIHDFRLSIGFTFSIDEETLIYKYFLTIFENSFGFHINDLASIAISGQRSSLKFAII